jgi:hypothetical protein
MSIPDKIPLKASQPVLLVSVINVPTIDMVSGSSDRQYNELTKSFAFEVERTYKM